LSKLQKLGQERTRIAESYLLIGLEGRGVIDELYAVGLIHFLVQWSMTSVKEIGWDLDQGVAEVVVLPCILVVICKLHLGELVEAIGTEFRGSVHGIGKE
jgi:hypothetical protein